MRYVLACYFLIGIVQGEILRVEVKDALTGAPLQASVTVVGKIPFIATGLTDQKGLVLLEVPSFAPLSVAIRAVGYGTACYSQQEVQKDRINAVLQPALRIHGKVEDSAGNPLPGATVAVEYLEADNCRVRFDPATQVQLTNDRGEYVLRDVDMGKEFRIVARHARTEERTVSKTEVSTAYPVARAKQLDFKLSER